MRRSTWSQAVVAGVLVVAMVMSVTGLLGSPGARIRITSPAAGARVSGVVDIRAAISDSASLSYVILGVDDERPCSTNSSPYVFPLDTRELADGPHRIFIEAYDRYGLVGSSKVITVYVQNGPPSPAPASKPSAPRVAARPAAHSPTRVAAGPKMDSRARTVSAPATVESAARVSPPMAARGPLPEPARIAAEPDLSAARPGALALKASGGVPAGPLSETPRMPARPITTPRGHTVVLNGRPVSFDVAPYIADGRMQAGFRAMFESVGAAVSWHANSRTAHSLREGLRVRVSIGQRSAKVNGRHVEMAVPAVIQQGRTMVPVRFFAEATGSIVYWDSETRIASVRTSAVTVAERTPGS